MNIQAILSKCDHTLLKPDAKWDDVRAICDDAVRFSTASVCISPCHVANAAKYLAQKIPVCTVIGFPSGCHTRETKLFETGDALEDGADEIDMVINIGALKSGDTAYVGNEIASIKQMCGDKILKVIIETCLLTQQEKITMCRIVTDSGADFIKTSTGFAGGGATIEDIELFKANIGPGVRMKAAGGISSIKDAQAFIDLGCARIGTSRIVRIAKEQGL